MKRILIPALLFATPAAAAKGPFFSLANSDFVVVIGFVVFIGILVYFKVPGMLMGMLDARATGIRNDLDEARAIREEAATLLASYERKTREAQQQADEIVAAAKADAESIAKQARADLAVSVERRIAAAEEQIASARDRAVRDVRDRAIMVATAVAGDVVARQLSAQQANVLIDSAIDTVQAKLH